MKLNYEMKETRIMLCSLGMRDDDAVHFASILCKWDSRSYCPDSEVARYLTMFRELLSTPHKRRWEAWSYEACYYIWRELARIWQYRKSLI